jgi:DNA-binding MarR family transcriptional regulator
VSTTSDAPARAEAGVKEALLAYLDALALAEPIQARLWQEARITLTQLSVLRLLRTGPQTAGRVGRMVGLSPASVTRVVDRLERQGLVSRHRESEDRRCVLIRLEPAGERLLGEVRVLRGSELHIAVESLSVEERDRLTNALQMLVERTRAVTAPAGVVE